VSPIARSAISADAEWGLSRAEISRAVVGEHGAAGLSPSAAARESIRAAWDIPGEHGGTRPTTEMSRRRRQCACARGYT
jgi:hypothetical protein